MRFDRAPRFAAGYEPNWITRSFLAFANSLCLVPDHSITSVNLDIASGARYFVGSLRFDVQAESLVFDQPVAESNATYCI